ncbi:MAG: hypothetical protein JWR19_4536 [Pedosphaera sp.]|jgi:hypothetical protein|nr:hypothetical protein [Pedosphaera sp.]
MFPLLLYPLLSAMPMGVLVVIVKVWHWLQETKGLKTPVKEKLLRGPGESTRKKKEELDDKITDAFIYILGLPLTFVTCYLTATRFVQTLPAGFWTILFVVALGIYGVLVVRVLDLLEKRQNWRRGLSGEKAVGEELNRLMADGCHVFHDFPLDQKGNIDHIVVAPSGVYAVETKTRSKGEASKTQKAHEVIYDGKRLQFPERQDKEDLIQARNQAKSLSVFLGREVGTAVAVKPVLTLPGWSVTTKAPGEVAVLNHKQIRAAIITESPVLSEQEMKQIVQQLDQKCRDVEF